MFFGKQKRPPLTTRPFYKRIKDGRPNNIMARIDKRTVICRDYQFVYCSVPKVANTTIHIVLANQLGMISHSNLASMSQNDRHKLGNSFKKRDNKILIKPSALSDMEVKDIDTTYFKFVFVRNPFSRIASAYLDKIYNKKVSDVHNALGMKEDEHVPFDLFLNYLKDGGLYERDYWCPQVFLLPYEISFFNDIGYFETLEADLTRIMIKIFNRQPNSIFASSNRTSASNDLRSLYSKEAEMLVTTLYEMDFEEFGYNPILD